MSWWWGSIAAALVGLWIGVKHRSLTPPVVPQTQDVIGRLCCFCGKDIAVTAIDPCRVVVETGTNEWQAWYCHALCFKERLTDPPDGPGLFAPAHF